MQLTARVNGSFVCVVREKVPLGLVSTPIFVPLMAMDAKGMGWLRLEMMVPLSVRLFCANKLMDVESQRIKAVTIRCVLFILYSSEFEICYEA